MTDAFDPRIVRLGIEIDGQVEYFEDLDIRAQGQKTANPIANNCVVKISNLTRDKRHEIITKATPTYLQNKAGRKPVYVSLDVGRKSYGTFRLFEGTAYTSTVTPPPDLGIVLRVATQIEFARILQPDFQPPIIGLKELCLKVARKYGLTLEYKVANDINIGNYSVTGGLADDLENLQLMGNVYAHVDNRTLVVTGKNQYRSDAPYVLTKDTGMISVPQATERGLMAQMLITPGVQVGSQIEVKSEINPSVNGDGYRVMTQYFDIANRDQPFYYTILCDYLKDAAGTL